MGGNNTLKYFRKAMKVYLKRTRRGVKQFVSSRMLVMLVCFCAAFIILVCRLFYLQIIKGEEYAQKYELQIKKTKSLKASRGNIYDRNGNLLAYNELTYSVTIEDSTSSDASVSERNEVINQTLEQIIRLVEKNGDSIIDTFGISLDPAGNYQFTQTSETQRLRFVADVYGYASAEELSKKQKNQTAEEIIHYLCTDEVYGYGLDDTGEDSAYIIKMVNMRYAMHVNSYQPYTSTVIASDVSDETRVAVMENQDVLNGVDIEEDSVRTYTDSECFSSVIGYTGQISQEEYDGLDEEQKQEYSKTDVVGKTGLEKVFDDVLQGTKGETAFYVNNVGSVTETISTTEPEVGNDLYLTIDSNIQKNTYRLIEEKLAGIILSRLNNVLEYDPAGAGDSSEIIIPVSDAYYAFIGNYIIDYTKFGEDDAGDAQKAVHSIFENKKAAAISEIIGELGNSGASAYCELSDEMQAYMDYAADTVLRDAAGIIDSDRVDKEDETYLAWTKEESISLYTYLNYAVSQNWIDTFRLDLEEKSYSDSGEIYQAVLDYLEEYMNSDSTFDKLLYEYLIRSGTVTGAQICAAAYEQGAVPMDETQYNGLLSGTVDAYSWLCDKIENLEITPGQLALEPCSAGAVVTDPDTGEVLACVSYPGYDSNRLSNNMDTNYYNQLAGGMNNIFYNRATQEKTAPGSTYKMVSAVAGLTEHVIDGSSIINCSGEYTKVTPSPKCWIYPGYHGSLSVVGALEVSCNDFFYEVGYLLGSDANGNYDSDTGIETLAKYAEMFGLGETSGLEIAEAEPEISDEYAVQSAIGQGTNNYTVSQLNRYVTAVANRGTVYSLSLADKVTQSDGTLVRDYEPEVVNTMDQVADDTWDLVQTGMERMVSGSSTFSGIDFSMAGKTGTAQQSTLHADHAVFVGYAPAEQPEISVAVRIAYGYSSAYAAEIGRDIARICLDSGSADEIITGSAAELAEALTGD